jgi:glycosyltransferase involved in cell wall biosynthesis
MTDGTLVSAIIPTYNRSHTVCSAIDSVLAQTYSPIEIIVVDDGSSDETEVKLRRYGSKVRVIRQPNAGAAAARNTGVRASRGEIVAFLDSDDIWLPEKTGKQVAALRAAGRSACCCVSNMRLCFNGGRTGTSFELAGLNQLLPEGLWLNPAEVLATRFMMFNQGVIIRRESFENLGGFDETLKLLEDYDLALRLSLQGSWAFVSEPLVVWRQSEDSLSHVFKQSTVFRDAWRSVVVDAAKKMPASPGYRRARNLALRACGAARRESRAHELMLSPSKFRRLSGRAYLRIQRAWATAFRNSPWYPKMRAAAFAVATHGCARSAEHESRDTFLEEESPRTHKAVER